MPIGMSHRNPTVDASSGLDGPDYVTLVIEWDALADDIQRGTPTASQDVMPTKDPDWMIDTAGKDSFPASDPPAWGSGHAAPSQHTVDGNGEIESNDGDSSPIMATARRYRTPILLGVLGLVAIAGIVVGFRFARSR